VRRDIESYGAHRHAVGEWFVPDGDGPFPTVVLVHGGFWRKGYDRSLEVPVALDLATRGYLVWNVDYRSSASPWQDTLTDVAAAYEHVFTNARSDQVDGRRVAAVGHSAGGHLVAWLAGRRRLPAGAPGHDPDAHLPTLVIPQAGVVALRAAAQQGLGNDAPEALVGGSPAQYPDRYASADPTLLLPTGVSSVLISGTSDGIVPHSQSEIYHREATAVGDDSRLELVPGDHFIHLDPESTACQRMRAALAEM
jgi:acetyl esterase/lipase